MTVMSENIGVLGVPGLSKMPPLRRKRCVCLRQTHANRPCRPVSAWVPRLLSAVRDILDNPGGLYA